MKKEFYNKAPEEEEVQERAKARDIIQVVLDYGVSQNQILHMISLLALELENNEQMKGVTSLISTYKENKTSTSAIITGE